MIGKVHYLSKYFFKFALYQNLLGVINTHLTVMYESKDESSINAITRSVKSDPRWLA